MVLPLGWPADTTSDPMTSDLVVQESGVQCVFSLHRPCPDQFDEGQTVLQSLSIQHGRDVWDVVRREEGQGKGVCRVRGNEGREEWGVEGGGGVGSGEGGPNK